MTEPTLSAEFARLRADEGDWDADITVTPQPGAPPQASKGRRRGRLISGGRWLIIDFQNHTTGFEGHGVYGYNPAIGRYVATWVDDMRTNLYLGEGEWDETSRVITYRWTASLPGGEARVWKETTEFISENERVCRTLFPTPGGEFEMMRAVYRKVF